MNCASLIICYDPVLLAVPLTYADVALIDAAAARLLEQHRDTRIPLGGGYSARLDRKGRLRAGRRRPTFPCSATLNGALSVGTLPSRRLSRFHVEATDCGAGTIHAHSADERELVALCGVRDLAAHILPYAGGHTRLLQDSASADPRGGGTSCVTYVFLPQLLLHLRQLAVSRLGGDALRAATALIDAGTGCTPGDLVEVAQALTAAPVR